MVCPNPYTLADPTSTGPEVVSLGEIELVLCSTFKHGERTKATNTHVQGECNIMRWYCYRILNELSITTLSDF